jgi:hypothetical protein
VSTPPSNGLSALEQPEQFADPRCPRGLKNNSNLDDLTLIEPASYSKTNIMCIKELLRTEPTDQEIKTLSTRVAVIANIFSASHNTSHAINIATIAVKAHLTYLATALGGTNIQISKTDGLYVSYQKTFNHPKTGLPIDRHYTITAPHGLTQREIRNLKATLKIGNPRTYGTPGINEVPLSAKGPTAKHEKPSLDDILNNNYVITIKNSADAKFGALAVLHQPSNTVINEAYIGQVVNGPRDPLAGTATPLLGNEKEMVVKGGGTLAVTEALKLAAHLGYEQARLYTDRQSLGERKKDANGEPTNQTFYDKFGEMLGISVLYRIVHKANYGGIHYLSLPNQEAPSGQIGRVTKPEYHYTYTGLEQILAHHGPN